MKNKQRVDFVYEILSYLTTVKHEKLTRIMYVSGITNIKHFKIDHFDPLIKCNYVLERSTDSTTNGKVYEITDKGRNLLKRLQPVIEALNELKTI